MHRVIQSTTQPFLVSSRNAPGVLRDGLQMWFWKTFLPISFQSSFLLFVTLDILLGEQYSIVDISVISYAEKTPQTNNVTKSLIKEVFLGSGVGREGCKAIWRIVRTSAKILATPLTVSWAGFVLSWLNERNTSLVLHINRRS